MSTMPRSIEVLSIGLWLAILVSSASPVRLYVNTTHVTSIVNKEYVFMLTDTFPPTPGALYYPSYRSTLAYI